MMGTMKPTLLLLLLAVIFTIGVPLLVYSLLPKQVRVWLIASETIPAAISVGLVCTMFMAAMAYLSYRVWLSIGRHLFGYERIDEVLDSWNKRR